MNHWIFHTFESEISVLRADNDHGKRSHGWAHPDKKWIVGNLIQNPGDVGAIVNAMYINMGLELRDFLNNRDKNGQTPD